MALVKCEKCGRMFSMGEDAGEDVKQICSRCLEDKDDDFKKVRSYVYDHVGCSIREVSVNTDVSEATIREYVRQGRIEIYGEGKAFKCAGCERMIFHGKYCDTCYSEVSSNLNEIGKQLRSGDADPYKFKHVKK